MNICSKLFSFFVCILLLCVQHAHAKNAANEVLDINNDTIVCDSLKYANATKKLNELKSNNKKKEGIVKEQGSFYEKFLDVFTIEHMLTKKRPVLSPRDSSRFAEFTQLRQNAKGKEALPKKNVQGKQSVDKVIMPDNKKDGDNGNKERKIEECKKYIQEARIDSAKAEKKLKKAKDKKNKYDIEKCKGELENAKKAIANYSKELDKFRPKKKTVCIDSLTNENLKQEEKRSRELDRKIELLEWANGKTDTIIYNKYILNTLKAEYNKHKIIECRNIVDYFVKHYEKYAVLIKGSGILRNLIENYEKYRIEMLEFLKGRKDFYSANGYKLKYINARSEFNTKEYYSIYQNRKNKPSIYHINNVLEDWEKAIDKNEITEEKMNELIERLEPRP